jgi:phosphate transport system ATP-binding protein
MVETIIERADAAPGGAKVSDHSRVALAPARDLAAPDRVPVRVKIAVRNLDFFYGTNQALKGVALDIPEKQVTGMIGPSGCGKSTFLRVLNRLYDLYPDQRATGEVRLDGEDILAKTTNLSLLRGRIGMVFQVPTPLPMSVYDNIALALRLYRTLSRADVDLRVESALSRAALWSEAKDRLRTPAESLSGGQQQRLCIARALAMAPDVLLLDEPTSALDPLSMEKIEELIIDLKQDVTIALVTHNMEQAARCADQVAFFFLGEMIEAGSQKAIFDNPVNPKTQQYVSGEFG